jgi:hypothetical protein
VPATPPGKTGFPVTRAQEAASGDVRGRPRTRDAVGDACLSLARPLQKFRPAVSTSRRSLMKYALAWLVGIPPILILAWFLVQGC